MLHATTEPVHGSPDLLRKIRARFVEQGTTMNRLCKENRVTQQWAHDAAAGKRRGPAARALALRLARAAGLTS